MTTPKTHDLLKKINYLEADIEIQKQVLFSIPSDQKEEMEKTIRIIATQKEEIEVLRQEIKEIDPDEYQRIVVYEKAINEFKQIATEKKFQSIIGRNVNEDCVLQLKDTDDIECLIKACDENGDWTIITMDGKIKHFTENVVAEKPPETPQY